ncbi:zinc-finger domain-containing protein [Paenibacillus gorillae]|uniref:zinc-finger domain-containing protein n=1 Tax=Paenibacillus gorillae TaxID=1243662 RepID=UPI003B508737
MSNLLEGSCANCPKRAELGLLHGTTFSKIDGFCNRECQIGMQLQDLGGQLRSAIRPRVKVDFEE